MDRKFPRAEDGDVVIMVADRFGGWNFISHPKEWDKEPIWKNCFSASEYLDRGGKIKFPIGWSYNGV